MWMVELIDKWEVVNKLIRLENNYQFYKEKWDADVLYRRICELEIGIGKTPGIDLVRCKDCWKSGEGMCSYQFKNVPGKDFCGDGERKGNERKAD